MATTNVKIPMIWYIKNWHRFTADNKMGVAVGVLLFMYSGYMLYVLVFPQYVNITFHKSLLLLMFATVAYGGYLMTKGFRTREKMEKRVAELKAEIAVVNKKTAEVREKIAEVNEQSRMYAQTFERLKGEMDQLLAAIVSNADNRKNSADLEKSDAALMALLEQFNAKQEETINFIKDINRVG